MRSRTLFLLGIAATLAAGALWHGPLGASARLAARIEGDARATLDHYEMQKIEARLQRGPLKRRVLLAGPADDFQQAEIVRMMEQIPGVADARWTNPPRPSEPAR